MFCRTLSFIVALMLRTAVFSSAFQRLPFATVSRFSTTAVMASTAPATSVVSVGDVLPAVQVSELTATSPDGKPETLDLHELGKGKKVAIFGVPGAFTPGCSKSHLPSFITAQEELKAKGVEATFCVATNDAYVMEAWGRTSGGTDAGIRFLSDSAGELTKQLGLVLETPNGIRTKRFSLIADDNKVTYFFDSDKEASNTWAPSVLSAL